MSNRRLGPFAAGARAGAGGPREPVSPAAPGASLLCSDLSRAAAPAPPRASTSAHPSGAAASPPLACCDCGPPPAPRAHASRLDPASAPVAFSPQLVCAGARSPPRLRPPVTPLPAGTCGLPPPLSRPGLGRLRFHEVSAPRTVCRRPSFPACPSSGASAPSRSPWVVHRCLPAPYAGVEERHPTPVLYRSYRCLCPGPNRDVSGPTSPLLCL